MGLAFGGGAIIRVIAQFGQAMSTVRAVTGATVAQFDILRARARQLGAETRFSATQAAEGMLALSRAGFSVAQVLGAITGTLTLAQAGALALGRAADIASNVLSSFRLQVRETGRVVDVLAAAANSANTNVEQLAQGLKLVAPVAAGLGVTLETTVAAIGALSNNGLQATLAGTGLRRVLAELESPTNATKDILRSLGVTTDEVRVSQVGLVAALERLREAGIDTGLALEIFGQRGGPAFEVLVNNIPLVIQLTRALENAGGTSARVSTIMDDNLNGALLRVKSALESVVLSFGDFGAESALTTSFDALADALRFMGDNIGRVLEISLSLLLALTGPKLLAIAAGFLGIGTAAGTATGAVVALTFAVRVLLRALLIGFVIEAINSIVSAIENMNRVVAATPATWGDAATVAVDRFVNGLIGGLVAFSRGIPNVIRIITDPFATGLTGFFDRIWDVVLGNITFEDLDDLVSENMRVAFHNALQRVGEEFRNDIGRRYLRIASEEQLGFFRRANEGPDVTPGDELPAITETVQVNPPPGQITPLTEDQLDKLRQLQDRLEPVAAATRLLAEEEMLLQVALQAGNITTEDHVRLTALLGSAYEDLLDPLGAVHRELDQEQALAGVRIDQRGVELDLLARELQLRNMGVTLSVEERVALRQRLVDGQALNAQLGRESRLYAQLLDPVDEYRKNLEALNRVIELHPELAGRAAAAEQALRLQFLDTQTSVEAGAERGFIRLAQASLDSASQIENGLRSAFRGAEDALTEFVTKGEADFGGLVDSILADLARFTIRQTITGPLQQALAGAFDGGGAAGGAVAGAGATLQGGIEGALTGNTGGLLGRLLGRTPGINPAASGTSPIPPGATGFGARETSIAPRQRGDRVVDPNAGLYDTTFPVRELRDDAGAGGPSGIDVLGDYQDRAVRSRDLLNARDQIIRKNGGGVLEDIRGLEDVTVSAFAGGRGQIDTGGASSPQALIDSLFGPDSPVQQAMEARASLLQGIIDSQTLCCDRIVAAIEGAGGAGSNEPAGAERIPEPDPLEAEVVRAEESIRLRQITSRPSATLPGSIGVGAPTGSLDPVAPRRTERDIILPEAFRKTADEARRVAQEALGNRTADDVRREIEQLRQDRINGTGAAGFVATETGNPFEELFGETGSLGEALDEGGNLLGRVFGRDGLFGGLVSGAGDLFGGLLGSSGVLGSLIGESEGLFGQLFQTFGRGLSSVLGSVLENATGGAGGGGGLLNAVGSIVGSLFSGGAGAAVSAAPIFAASGGLIRGAGTGTSDSISARLPAGSFIVNARATARHRQLLDVIAGAPSFATGGGVNARISNGEYYLGPGVSARYGGLLNNINDDAPAFQTGGVVLGNRPRAPTSGPPWVVEIIDQRSGNAEPVKVSQPGRRSDGRQVLRIMVDDTVREGMATGEYDGPVASRYGIQPVVS